LINFFEKIIILAEVPLLCREFFLNPDYALEAIFQIFGLKPIHNIHKPPAEAGGY
jgi:hypothetical protein